MADDMKHDDDVLIFTSSDERKPLLPDSIETVEAVCIEVETRTYFRKGSQDPKLTFTFEVVSPKEFKGDKLNMYLRNAKKWEKEGIPKSAHIFKNAKVATGGRYQGGESIRKGWFINKLFVCKVRKVQSGVYTVIEEIVEPLGEYDGISSDETNQI